MTTHKEETHQSAWTTDGFFLICFCFAVTLESVTDGHVLCLVDIRIFIKKMCIPTRAVAFVGTAFCAFEENFSIDNDFSVLFHFLPLS